MANFLQLRWTKVVNKDNTPNGYYYDSNLIKIKGHAIIQIETSGRKSLEITYLQRLTGEIFTSFVHDYFGELHINPIPIIGVGQILKFRVNELPDVAYIMGDDLTDSGDINPDDPVDILNGFAGRDGEYFRSINGEIFAGK